MREKIDGIFVINQNIYIENQKKRYFWNSDIFFYSPTQEFYILLQRQRIFSSNRPSTQTFSFAEFVIQNKLLKIKVIRYQQNNDDKS